MKIVNDHTMGLSVVATDTIFPMTLISEYSGDIYLTRDSLFINDNSIMELLHTSSADTSLTIIPHFHANLAKYLCGINNREKKSIKKQNVKSIRININDKVRIFLFAFKTIQQGEFLYYNYNEDGYGYPTENFI